jgi:apolipoprotein N-acyltransferase
VPPGAYVQAPSAYYGQGAPTGYSQFQPRPQANSNAIVALVLAIVAWLAIPVIPAIVALVLASKASKEIEASNGWLTGSGMALTAKILSWINIAFSVIIGLFIAFIVIAVIASGAIEPSTVPTTDFGT